MGKEIERKFLLKGDAWRDLAQGTMYRQGYLNSAKERTVRVRTVGDKAFLTIKGITVGATRAETSLQGTVIRQPTGGRCLQQIARLTVQHLTNPRQRVESDALHLAGFQQADVLLGDPHQFGPT